MLGLCPFSYFHFNVRNSMKMVLLQAKARLIVPGVRSASKRECIGHLVLQSYALVLLLLQKNHESQALGWKDELHDQNKAIFASLCHITEPRRARRRALAKKHRLGPLQPPGSAPDISSSWISSSSAEMGPFQASRKSDAEGCRPNIRVDRNCEPNCFSADKHGWRVLFVPGRAY